MSQTITVEKVDVTLLRTQRDELLEVIEESFLPSKARRKESLNGIANLLDAMLDAAEGFSEGISGKLHPSLSEYASSRDGCTVLHVDTPNDWPENENGPILRIYLNDDTDDPIFDNPRETT